MRRRMEPVAVQSSSRQQIAGLAAAISNFLGCMASLRPATICTRSAYKYNMPGMLIASGELPDLRLDAVVIGHAVSRPPEATERPSSKTQNRYPLFDCTELHLKNFKKRMQIFV